MNLHELLRDLVARQGPSVVESAEGFRAALDDFLTEDEATTGELNLLVDAVRIGGVQRLHSIIEHGGDPRAAITEAGDAFARDRGTDDVTRCRWAVAVVGYALGWVGAADIPPESASAPTPPLPPPTPSVPVQPVGSPPSPPSPPSTSQPPQTFPETETVYEPPTAPISVPLPSLPPRPPPRRTGRILLVVLLVAAVIVGAVGLGMWLNSDDEPSGSANDGKAADSGNSGSPGADVIPVNSALVPITDDSGNARIYAVDVDTGAQVPLTSGPNDRVPSVSPDRRTVMYVVNTPGSGDATPMVLDLASRETRPLLTDESPCESGGRPGFSPSGDKVALVCYDNEGNYTATYVVDLQGREVGLVPVPPGREPQGTPTWTSNTSLVFSMAGETDDEPATLWAADVDGDVPTQLTVGDDGSDTHPDWSAEAGGDGLLLFSHHPVNEFFGDLMTADAAQQDGPHTEDAQWESPAWSPDGKRVLFIQRLEDGTEQLAEAPLDDLADVTPIPGIDGEVGVPAWGTR